MNSNIYRLVFSRARAMLVAVQECAAGQGKGRHGATRATYPVMLDALSVARFGLPPVTLAILMLTGLPVASFAQVVANPNAGANRPTVVQTANGLQQVNITRPSGAGVSVNGYTQFDVPKAGVILNNSPTLTNTQQAGYINGNPNLLPGGSARIIVNQVSSSQPSQLRGYVEVAGPGAQVVISNPSGLYVDGAGFINVPRATLTTGTPVFGGSGSLDAFRVTGGQITVAGAGLNASNVDQVDVIARAVQANAAIYANRLNVVAGANQVDANTLAATPIAGDGVAPALGIDVSQLGGMYANKIILASTENGVGVSLRGVQAAQAGDMTLTAQGKLILAGQTNASGNLIAYARDGIENSGITYATGGTSLNTDGALTNTGTIAAQQWTNVYGASVASTGTLAAGVNPDGSTAAPADLTVTATSGAVSATGTNLASGNATLQGTGVSLAGSQTSTGGNLGLAAGAGNLDLTGATTTAGAGLVATAQGAIVNDRGNLSSGGATSLTAGSLSNNGGQIVSQGATTLQSAGAISNVQGVVQAGGALNASGASLDNTAGRVTSLNGDGLSIGVTGALVNAAGTTATGAQGGVIGGNGNAQLAAGAMTNSGQISAAGNETINAATFNNNGGSVTAGGALAATVAGAMSNQHGSVSADSMSISAQSIDDTAGQIAGNQLALSTTGDLINRGGSIQQAGQTDTTIHVGGALDDTGGSIAANGQNLTLQAGTFVNNGGTVSHAGTGMLAVDVQGAATNAGGTVQTNGAMNLQAASLGNAGGTVAAQGNATVAVQGALDNTNALMHGGDSLSVQAGGAATNAGGKMEAAGAHGTLAVAAQSLDNTNGRTVNAGDGATQVTVQQALVNAGTGVIGGNGDVGIQAGALTNHAQIVAQGNATVNASSMDNSNGTVSVGGTLATTVAGALNNQNGLLSADTQTISAASLDNSAGRVEANQLGIATTGDLLNKGGAIVQYGSTDTTIVAGGTLDDTSGTIAANGQNLTVQAGTLVNDSGKILHAGAGTLAVTSQNAASNAGGAIQGNGNLQLQAASLANAGGKIAAQGTATVGTTGDLGNQQGSLYGQTGLTVNAGGNLDNTGGSQQTAGNLAVSAGGALTNVNGTVSANGAHGQATVSAASIDDTQGLIGNAGDGATTVTGTTAILNTGGQIGGNGDVTVNTQTLTNTSNGTMGGLVGAAGALALNVTNRLDNTGGAVYGGNGLTLVQPAVTLINDGGQILGKTDVTLDVASMSNTGGSVLANRDIAVQGAMSGSGTMTAGRNLALDVVGDYTNDAANHLHADGDMRISATGTLTNTGTLAATGALTASGANVVNNAGADINSANTTVTATHALTNAGRIEGDTVQTSSPTMTNTGTVIGNNVTVQGNDIINSGASGLMAAVQNLNLYGVNSVQNLDGANLYSAGNIQIARDGTRDLLTGLLANQVGTLLNSSATIQAEGDLDVAANQVVNKRTTLVTAPGAPTTASQTLTLWQAGFTGLDLQAHASITFPQWNWATGLAPVSTPQTNALRAPITVTVDKSTVTNLDTTKQTLSLTQAPTEQYAQVDLSAPNCDLNTRTCTRDLTTNPTQYYQSITDNGTTYSITFWPDWNPSVNIRPDLVRQANFGHDYNEISRTTTTTTATDQLVSASVAGLIQTGGSLRINSAGGSILNESSTMTAGGDLIRIAPGGMVQDIGTALQQTSSTQDISTFYWHQRTGGSQDTQYTTYPVTPQAPITVMALPSIALGNQSVQTTAQTINVTTVNRLGQTVTGSGVGGGSASGSTVSGATGSTAGVGSVSAGGGATVGQTSARTGPRQTLGTSMAGIPNLVLPTNGLYSYRTAPGSTYLIATDPRFTQYAKFISSDYMLGQLGLDPMMTEKRLGDGLYEEKVIRDEVTQLTGRTYLNGYSDNLTEYQALMDSGVAYAKQFNLAPGIGLSDQQMAQLTTDMVWLVSQDVTLPDGTHQTVLVPKLYLAQSDAVDLQSTGALVAGGKVSLNASGDVNNSGKIVGDLATQIIGNNIVNRGQIGGAGNTVVQAQQDVRNLGGRITGTDTLVTAGRDVINESQTISNMSVLANGNRASATAIGSVASITGTNNVGVLAGRDLTSKGATISAGNNLALGSGRDMTFGTIATGTRQDVSAHGGQDYIHDQTTVNHGSTVQAGGSIAAVSGRDMTLTNTNVQSGADTTLLAGQNLSVGNATDTHTHSEGALSNRQQASYTQSSYDETVQGSNVQAGHNATLAGGQSDLAAQKLANAGITAAPTTGTGSVSVIGSAVSAGNDGKGGSALAIVATQNITVGEAREVHDAQSDSHSRSSGFLSRSSTHDQSSNHADLGVGSTVTGDTVAMTANNDLTVRQSTVVGSDEVGLTAKQGNVLITAGQNTRETSTLHEESKSGVSAFAGQGGIGVSVGSSGGNATDHVLAVTQSDARSLVGATNGNISINAGKDVGIVGSDLIAGAKPGNTNAGNIDITGQNIAVVAGVDHVSEQTSQASHSSGVGVALVGTPLDTARNLEQAQQSTSGVTRVKETLGEIGHSAGTLPQVAITVGSSHSDSSTSTDSVTHDGSSVAGAGNVRLRATGDGRTDAAGKALNGDILISGSAITAGGKAALDAQRNVDIEASTDTYQSSTASNSGGWKFNTAVPSLGDVGRSLSGGPNNSGVGMFPYNAQSANASGDTAAIRQNASTVTGNGVTVISRTGDIRLAGSGIGAQNDVTLSATQGKIDLVSGQESSSQRNDSSSRQIGDLGGNGYSGTVGIQTQSHHLDATQTSQNTVRSQVTSQNGSVTMVAKDDITAPGADISARQNVTLIGKNVNLDPGTDTTAVNQQDKSSQYGTTLALSGYSVQAAQAAENAARAKEEGKSGTVVALYAAQAVIAGANAYAAGSAMGSSQDGPQASKSGPVGVEKTGNSENSNGGSALFKVTASVGGGSQESQSHSQSSSIQGTTVTAGNNVKIVATGSGATGADGYAADGDINARGAQITGKNVDLTAARDVNLQSAQDTSSQNSASSGSSASIGVGFGLGGQQNGFTLELAASQNHGNANGDSVTNRNTHVAASDTLTVSSGRDTNLQGAQASGNTVVANVGRNLNIESRQDTDTYHSTQESSGAQVSICVPPFCYGTTATGSASVSQGNTDSTYESVVEQSGIYAGNGGLDVTVKGNTDLKGGVIASTADPSKNHVTTGTLTTSDLENKAEYKSDSSTIAGSFDSRLGMGQNLTNSGMSTAMGNAAPASNGSASGTTRSAITQGTVTITDNAGQQALTGKTADETVAGLNRETVSANQAIGKIFDQQKVADQQVERQLAAQTVQQAMPIVDKALGDLLDKQPEAVKVVVHGLVGGAITALVGRDFAKGAAGTAAGTAVIATLNENLGSLGLDESTRNAVLQTVGMVVAGGVAGGGANGAAAAGAAGMADAYNRQLHPQERDLARQIAAQGAKQGITKPDGSPYTSDEIQNAMRSANNSQYGETSATGALVPLNANTKASDIYDTTGMVVVNDGAGHNSLMQDPSMLATPSQTLQNLITQNTGGSNSPYSWNMTPPDKDSVGGPVYSNNSPYPGGSCATGECGAGVGPAKISAPPPTTAQLAEATDKGGTALALASPWLPPPFDLGAAAMAGAFKATNYLLSPPTLGAIAYDSATIFIGARLPAAPVQQTIFGLGTALAQPVVVPQLDDSVKK